MNKFFVKILKSIIVWLTSIYEKSHSIKESQLYNPLSPTENAEKVDVYLDALTWSLENRGKIKNIAISGPYGSGKSSVLKTFQNKNKFNKKYKFLYISLANFVNEEKEKKKIEKNEANIKGNEKAFEVSQRLIELSILQQLLYYEHDKNIPGSRFKRIQTHGKFPLILLSTGSIIYLISFLYLKFPDLLANFSLFKLPLKYQPLTHNISVIILLLGSLFLISKVIKILKSITIKNVELGNAKIEIGDKVSNSILNHHLDEILYFFESTDNNIVIIEDLDRFEQTDIFAKLREINLLINSSKKVKNEVVFIYAIRDDIFKNKDRTKFFDFIIPIIPVINSSNSTDKLLKIFEENNREISKNLIEDVSLFIDDMRLLYNILNEYYIYFTALSSSLDQDKLFAMIVYKNIDPEDFTKLSHNEGVLYEILNSKKKLIEDKKNTINREIREIKDRIKYITFNAHKSIKELRALYIYKLIDKILNTRNTFFGFFINNTIYQTSQAVDDNVFMEITSKNSISYRINNNTATQQILQYNFAQIEKQVDTKYTYKERESFIEYDHQIAILQNKIEKLEEEKDSLNKVTFKELINEDNLDIITAIKNKKLINIMLRNGYIDEEYFDYISVFHEGSITKNDHEFLLNVKTQTKTVFDYKLNNIENLLNKISISDFEKDFILNFSLIDFLLQSNICNAQIEKIFCLLANESDISFKFIRNYIDRNSNIELFIKKIADSWVNIWPYFENRIDLTKEHKDKYLETLIKYADVKNIIKIFNKSEEILINHSNFLTIHNNTSKVKDIISGLKLDFIFLEETIPDELLDFIINHNYYVFNEEILRFILRYKNQYNETDFDTKNYYAIKQSGIESLIKYIEEHINEYIESVFLTIDSNINEPEETLSSLLNNNKLALHNKKKIVKKTITVISDAGKINNQSAINMIFNNLKVLATWENLLTAYILNDKILTNELIVFINIPKNSSQLSLNRISSKTYDEDIIKPFCRSILLTEKINNECYLSLLKSVPYSYNSLNFVDLTYDKVRFLIEQNILNMTSENFDLLKSNIPVLANCLIEYKHTDFIKKIDVIEIEDIDVLELVKSVIIPFRIKKEVMNYYDTSIFTNDNGILTIIGNLLLKNNDFEINETIYKAILCSRSLISYKKIKLFNKRYNIMGKNSIDQFLNSMNEPYSRITIHGKMPSIELNDTNIEFLRILKDEKRYIKNYIEKNTTIKVINY